MFGIGVGVLGSSRGALGRFVLSQIGAATAFAASPRKLRDGYSGPAMRVRRSLDNAELDIGFTVAGDLDEAALLAFVGSFSGFVTRMYDQSGNARDLTQATAANQPRIVNAGVIDRIATAANRPGYRTDGVSQSMATASFVVPQPLTRSSVMQFLDVGNSPGNPNYISGVNSVLSLYTPNTGAVGMFAGSSLTIAPAIINGAVARVVEIYNGVTSIGSFNGALTSGNTGTVNCDGVTIGRIANGPQYGTAIFSDIIIFPQALITSDRLALELSQKTYYGTP